MEPLFRYVGRICCKAAFVVLHVRHLLSSSGPNREGRKETYWIHLEEVCDPPQKTTQALKIDVVPSKMFYLSITTSLLSLHFYQLIHDDRKWNKTCSKPPTSIHFDVYILEEVGVDLTTNTLVRKQCYQGFCLIQYMVRIFDNTYEKFVHL